MGYKGIFLSLYAVFRKYQESQGISKVSWNISYKAEEALEKKKVIWIIQKHFKLIPTSTIPEYFRRIWKKAKEVKLV